LSLVDILGPPVADPIAAAPATRHTCRATPPVDPTPAPPPRRHHGASLALGILLTLLVGAVAGWFGSGLATSPATIEARGLPAEIAGYAELYTARQLSAVGGVEPSIWVNQAAAIAGEHVDEHTWLVTVAVDSLELVGSVYEPADLQRFNVLVTTAGGNPAAIGLPSRVPTATGPVDVAPLFPDPVPDDQAIAAMAFIEAYLTGGSQLSRYVATPTSIVRFEDAPYNRVSVRPIGMSSHGEIRLSVAATKSNGITHQLEYVVTMVTSNNVWMVADIAPAGP
jgi:hypothetical protein